MVLNFPDNNFTMLLAALLRSPSSQSVVLSIMKYDISERVISRLAKASRERSGLFAKILFKEILSNTIATLANPTVFTQLVTNHKLSKPDITEQRGLYIIAYYNAEEINK